MPSDLEQIQTIKSQTLALLVDARTNPKPSYSIDGQSVRWDDYVAGLERTVDWCNRKLASEVPYEEQTQAYT